MFREFPPDGVARREAPGAVMSSFAITRLATEFCDSTSAPVIRPINNRTRNCTEHACSTEKHFFALHHFLYVSLFFLLFSPIISLSLLVLIEAVH